MDTIETQQVGEMSTPDLVAYLRYRAIDRPDFTTAEAVTFTGAEVLAIARRLAGRSR